ncbi:MscS Mechanosensitive ion channel [Luminiphilus syltensis NOR5-1B]|uniref:MscS Mechanosensitive ion channel n=1 Tax=Luminiphilus syltensis NOR5-1B TaxID=565045 RepID=B8KVI3_9GAMM|nr:mechanosensitive ion channel domain-containing protein [Luminiphilus syltensis]EED36125.1 MscS Mechanosensitive ion channel [Luminiphilus syltensis NOR5-1B]
MENINELLSTPLIVFGERSISVGQILEVLALVALGYLFVAWSARFVRARLEQRRVSPDLIQVISRAYLIMGLLILGFMVLDLLQVPLGAFAFVSGAVAIGVGFGAQNIINNFISGWILMWERPIKIGDFLEMENVRGTVEAINTRSTRIRRVDGVHLLVPNSFFLENTVTNWTLIDEIVRTSVVVGVAYGSDVQLVKRLLEQSVDEHADVLKVPERHVFFDEFGDNSLVFEVNFWIRSASERGLRVIRSELRFKIDEMFREHDISISFPQRDVHLDGEVRVISAKEA